MESRARDGGGLIVVGPENRHGNRPRDESAREKRGERPGVSGRVRCGRSTHDSSVEGSADRSLTGA